MGQLEGLRFVRLGARFLGSNLTGRKKLCEWTRLTLTSVHKKPQLCGGFRVK